MVELGSIVQPLDLAEWFPGPQPLEVELGCGDASFLAEYARRHPERNFIGVERLLGRLRKMDRKGRLYVAAGRNRASQYETTDEFKGGIYILSPGGRLLEFVPFPKDETTNCAFGGQDLKTLFVTSAGQLWSVPVSTPGRITAKR